MNYKKRNKTHVQRILVAVLMFLTICFSGKMQIYAVKDPVAEAKNSIVEIYYGITTDDGAFHRMKHASGVLISNQEDKAYILTVYNSVVAGKKAKNDYCKQHKIKTENNSLTDTIQIVTKGDVVASPAQILTNSKDKNFCILETDRGLAEKSPAKLGISKELVTGNKVFSLGFASDAGEKDDEANRYTEFTAMDVVVNEGSVQDSSANKKGIMYLQHSATITGGNHGGPLVDEKGYVVGINDVKMNNETDPVYYSLPVDEIREILDNYQVPYVSIDKEYSLESFKNLLAECQSLLESKEYKPKSKEALQEAVEHARTILQTNNPDEEDIREASTMLTDAKLLLVPKMKTTRKVIIALGIVIGILFILLIRLLLWKRNFCKESHSGRNSGDTESSDLVRHTKSSEKDFFESEREINRNESNNGQIRKNQKKSVTYDTKMVQSLSSEEEKQESDFYEGTVQLPDFYHRREQAVLYCVSKNLRKVIDKPRFYIGKRDDNDFVVLNNTVSRKHARIIWDKTRYYIEDLNSANGTQVNGIDVPLGTRFELKNGSHIMLADEKFIFELIKRAERKRKSS